MTRPLCVALVIVALLGAPAYALPGPQLWTPQAQLDSVIECVEAAAAPARTPVLLLHGGNGSADEFVGNYRTVLPRDGHPTCWLSFPGRLLGDLQVSVEYAVNAIRRLNDRFGRRIAVVGHSGGALVGSYALRFWPDLAARVEDYVGLAGVYERGSETFRSICAAPCPIGAHQIAAASRFLRGYAGRPLYPGPSYTAISTRFDEFVTPQPAAGRLAGARTIELQSLCPARAVEHGAIVLDALAYALARDALDHPGPASPDRVRRDCERMLIPGADPAGMLPDVVAFAVGLTAFASPAREPQLRCYLDVGCPKPRLVPQIVATSVARARRVTTSGRVDQPAGALDLCDGHVRIRVRRSGRTLSTRHADVGRDCRFHATQPLRGARTARGARMTVVFLGSRELLPAVRAVRIRVNR